MKRRGADHRGQEKAVAGSESFFEFLQLCFVLLDGALGQRSIPGSKCILTTILAELVKGYELPLLFVTNEVGMGIVPDNALSRKFRNAQGKINQMIAAGADVVMTVISGLPLILKGNYDPVSATHVFPAGKV